MLHPTALPLLHARGALPSAIKLVIGFAALCGVVSVAAAQTAPPVRRGTEVRVFIPAPAAAPERQIRGSLVRLQNDTVVIWTRWGLAPPDSVRVVLDRGWRLEALASSHGHGLAGAAIGAIFGALTGAAVGSTSWRPCTEQGFLACFMHPTQGEQTSLGAMLGATGGALLGLAVGRSIRSETWIPVHPADIGVAIIPRGLSIRLRF